MKHFYDTLTATKDRPVGFRITVTIILVGAMSTLLLSFFKTVAL